MAEGAGSTAYSTGTNHATLVGNPTWVLEDGIPSSNLDDGFSKRMYFDGTGDIVDIATPLTISAADSFSLKGTFIFDTIANAGLFGSSAKFARGIIVDSATVLSITNNAEFKQVISLTIPLLVGTKYDIEVRDDGAGKYEVLIDGVIRSAISASVTDFTIDQIGRGRFKNLLGLVYDVDLTLNGTTARYLGTGNQASDWLDQIGSNNGTVTGGETLRIPAAEGSNSLDAVGGTLTNPARSDGHNGAETELDFYNIADGGTAPTPAIVSSGVVLTDYSFGQILLNPMFKRTISSVLEDRQTLFAAVLTGDCLETANEYTQ